MSYVIRRADPRDAYGIASVHVETWQSHYRGQVPDDFLSSLSIQKRATAWAEALLTPEPQDVTFVAEDVAAIAGFCNVGPSRDPDAGEDTGELSAIYVSPSHQGKGIGSILMRQGLNVLQSEGFKTATLWVLRTNASTIRFYESRGWRADGHEKIEDRGSFVFDEIRYRVELL